MHVSQIYARFSPQVDFLFRRAMTLASRHRMVRVHHLIAAAGGLAGAGGDEQAEQFVGKLPVEWVQQAAASVEQDPTGCMDSPLTNSPTMRRVLQLACDRAGNDPIRPCHLLAMALCCWGEERPASRANARQVGDFCRSLAVRPLPAFDLAAGQTAASDGADPLQEADLTPTPSAEELEAMIGPPVTSDDLIRLYIKMKTAGDPTVKQRLADLLAYLRDSG